MTRNSHATSPNSGCGRGNDASREAFLYVTEGSPSHRSTPKETSVSVQAHVNLFHEVKPLRETLAQTQSTLEAVQMRLQALE